MSAIFRLAGMALEAAVLAGTAASVVHSMIWD
jgi:hypothetical protein